MSHPFLLPVLQALLPCCNESLLSSYPLFSSRILGDNPREEEDFYIFQVLRLKFFNELAIISGVSSMALI